VRTLPALPRVALLALAPWCASAGAQALVAHRGASYDAPENTLAAFALAWEQGADAIEGDFRLSADGRVVCIHDSNTERTAGAVLEVAATPLAALRKLDVGAWKAPRFAGERIPTLPEVLAALPAGRSLVLEVKSGPEILPALARDLAEADLDAGQVRVISFDAEVIAAVVRRVPALETYWLVGHERDEQTGRWTNTLDDVLPTLRRIGADGLDTSVPADLFDRAYVQGLRAAGLSVHTYTVNDPATAARLYWLGVDSITTDRPAGLRALLPRRDLRPHVRMHLALDGDLAGGSEDGTRVARLDDPREAAEPWTRGVHGQAWDLDAGGPLRIERPLPPEGTLALWLRPRRWYDHQTLFDTPRHPNAWEAWIGRSGELATRAAASGPRAYRYLHRTADRDRWLHVAVTWRTGDDASLALHVDGLRVDHRALPQSAPAPGDAFTLGGSHPGNDRGEALIDDVVLLDVALEPAEIALLMRAPPALR